MRREELVAAVPGFLFMVGALIATATGSPSLAVALGLPGALLFVSIGWPQTRRR